MRGEQRLTRGHQYALVNGRGKSRSGSLLVMKILPNGLELSRYGFSVSHRVGKAVVRNRVRRRLKEIMRVIPLKSGWDIVFSARPRAAEVSFAGLKQEVAGLLAKAGLLYEEVCLKAN